MEKRINNNDDVLKSEFVYISSLSWSSKYAEHDDEVNTENTNRIFLKSFLYV